MSPSDSDDLTETSAQEGEFLVLLISPDTAEHEPAYREVARFRMA
ncbi:MAG: hypothetical protein QOD74_2423 [Variibacter sp.]|jgi:hypothetical protein|nr:hypothetical protein [Variibacter sp.]